LLQARAGTHSASVATWRGLIGMGVMGAPKYARIPP
jgi:hypothetical protein